jgi:hypothetical protein
MEALLETGNVAEDAVAKKGHRKKEEVCDSYGKYSGVAPPLESDAGL